MTSRWLPVLPLFIFAMLSACSSGPEKPTDLTEAEYYQEAKEALDKRNFLVALERLKNLESRYPFGQYSEQAQLEMIYTHFNMQDLEMTLAEAERFVRLHPLHDQADYAYYMRGLATFEMSFNLIERRFSDDYDKRDVTPLVDSFNYFSELLIRYPESRFVSDAKARMTYLRERLASHELEVARYYMKRHAFIAAANRASSVVEAYPRTAVVGDALAILVEAYRELGLDEEEAQAFELLSFNYPKHRQLEDGQFVSTELAQTDRKSWLEVVSFGLIR
jgi:outer membrane protein assembly factor BamD